jgi:hypothetical protein
MATIIVSALTILCFFVSILFTGYTPFPGFLTSLRIGESARKSIAFLVGLNYLLKYSKLCGESWFGRGTFNPVAPVEKGGGGFDTEIKKATHFVFNKGGLSS